MARFPFTAVVRQDALKTALLLAIVDPRINGVLISGSRGSAKSTLVRSLEQVIPNQQLVTLPLGATEEMVSGTLKLQQALQSGEVTFSPGLLARAHGGLLYVDEVNLLPDHLVDLLLDVSASGVNHVERDGISHRHDAEFVLVGTMNPDEGELRPQLLDRFGLMAVVQENFTLEERREIVSRRVAFDADPVAVEREHQHRIDELRDRIEKAVRRLEKVSMPEAISTEIARRCADAGVEGVRADITFFRAARAHAALAGQSPVTAADLDAVEDLVLRHRRDPGIRDASDTPPGSTQSRGGGGRGASGSSPSGSRGTSETRSVPTGGPVSLPPWTNSNHPPKRPRFGFAERSQARSPGANPGVRHLPVVANRNPQGKPHWFRTLCDTDNIQRRPRRKPGLKLRYRYPVRRSLPVNLVLLDTSASTRLFQALSQAKAAIRELAHRSYLDRVKFGIVTFGNDQVDMVLAPQRAPHDIDGVLDSIRAGGGTPLHRAIHYVDGLVGKLKRKDADCSLFILTDGKVRGGVDHRSANLERTRTTVVDIELGNFRLGRSRHVARALGARYLHISELM
jgi:magnesium chelatase subunit D